MSEYALAAQVGIILAVLGIVLTVLSWRRGLEYAPDDRWVDNFIRYENYGEGLSGWVALDETGAGEIGRYDTYAEAKAAILRYAEAL